MTSWGPWFSAVVGLLTLIWGIVAYVRDSSGKRQAEQAERAARMIVLLEEIDLGGADVGLDSTKARALHEEQIRALQRIIRLGAVDFSERALRSGLSLFTVSIIAVYTVVFAVVGVGISNNAGVTNPVQKVVNTISGLTLVGLSVLGVVIVVVSWSRRRKSARRRRAAGMQVPTPLQTVRTTGAQVLTALAAYKLRRRQRALLKSTPEGQ